MQNTIKVCYNKHKATIPWPYEDSGLTMGEIKKQLDEVIEISYYYIRFLISNIGCDDDETINFYRDLYKDEHFKILLASHTPRHVVYNIRTILKLNGQESSYDECVICLDNKPNVANSDCYHDAVLCNICVREIDKCPICFNDIRGLESV